jgi:hypothetical protein
LPQFIWTQSSRDHFTPAILKIEQRRLDNPISFLSSYIFRSSILKLKTSKVLKHGYLTITSLFQQVHFLIIFISTFQAIFHPLWPQWEAVALLILQYWHELLFACIKCIYNLGNWWYLSLSVIPPYLYMLIVILHHFSYFVIYFCFDLWEKFLPL